MKDLKEDNVNNASFGEGEFIGESFDNNSKPQP